MPTIHDTSATLKVTKFLRQAVISKLAGEVGEPMQKLFAEHGAGYLGITFRANKGYGTTAFHVCLASTFTDYKLLKNDGVEFHLTDGSFFAVKFISGKMDWTIGGLNEKRNVLILHEYQSMQLLNSYISFIRIIAAKTQQAIDCHFKQGPANVHYKTEREGQELAQLQMKLVGETLHGVGNDTVNGTAYEADETHYTAQNIISILEQKLLG